MADLEDLPVCLVPGDVDGRLVLRVFHFVGEDEQVVFDVCKSGWGSFALGGVADSGHFYVFFPYLCDTLSSVSRNGS
jgi:hypothetical protein